jgi:MoaA/NifB/PqqE/SkfB family radical SAM enzyme
VDLGWLDNQRIDEAAMRQGLEPNRAIRGFIRNIRARFGVGPGQLPDASPDRTHAAPKIAQEIAAEQDTFCVLAWNHLQIAPNGTVKMCCIASEDISDGKRPMSLYTDTYDEIWNSAYMRSARRGMAAGEKISPCRRCYDEERSVGVSRRTQQNAAWLRKSTLKQEEMIAQAEADGWRVPDRPIFLQLNMGNLCNLACRMCSSQYSSKIESDPVHNKWMPAGYPDVARWRGPKLHLGPRPYFGVAYEGFYDYEVGGHTSVRWCAAAGSMKCRIPDNTKIIAIGLSLRTIGHSQPVTIRANGIDIFEGIITPEWTQRFEIDSLDNHTDLEISIESTATDIGGRDLGVGLLDAWIERKETKGVLSSNDRTLMRATRNAGWWAQPEVMFDEILGEPDRLRHLTFQGGEPFLVKEFESILDVLIDNGTAGDVTFEIDSNLTTIKPSTLSKLAKLKHVSLGASIDGIGPVLEYIRHPAVWADIEHNIERVAGLPNVHLAFNTAIQAYNLMDLPNIFRYCDGRGIDVHAHFLVGPIYLNVAVLPQKVRQAAIDSLSFYRTGTAVRPANRAAASYAVKFLTEHLRTQYRDQFMAFVKFTNDLDISRGQDFRMLFGDLVESFAMDGLQWTDETAYAARQDTSVAESNSLGQRLSQEILP